MDPFWLMVGWAFLSGKKRQTSPGVAQQPAPPPPTVYAYLYQLPDDGFRTTRMASGEDGKVPEEMGIFQDPDAARRVAQSKGWVLAWDGHVRQLQTRPGS